MDKHITNTEIYDYLEKKPSFHEQDIRISRHIAGCKECRERIKAVMYLKEHLDEEWEDLNIESIANLNKQVKTLDKQDKIQRNKTIFFKSSLNKVMAVAASFIIIFGISYFSSKSINNPYNKWEKNGVITSDKKLKDKVTGSEFKTMVFRLAGSNSMDLSMIKEDSSNLKVSEAAEAMAISFSLKDEEKMKLIAGMDVNSSLTYKDALDIFANFAGDIYVDEINGEKTSGNLAVNTKTSKLENIQVSGNLYILQGVSSVELNNVNVAGNIYVLGSDSVVLEGTSKAENVVVNKASGTVSITTEEKAKTSKIIVQSSCSLNGNYDSVSVASGSILVSLDKGDIKQLEVGTSALNIEFLIKENSLVENLNVYIPSSFSGEGLIKIANVSSANVKLDVKVEVINMIQESIRTEGSSGTSAKQTLDQGGSSNSNILVPSNIEKEAEKQADYYEKQGEKQADYYEKQGEKQADYYENQGEDIEKKAEDIADQFDKIF